ncbi:P-loop containing nucleoside triphosphate hydrolase protein [Morchella snyderi]|nr:P-loop containing nucleoside triphosphate hydrolase protein [Morchella snyderi]
MRDGDQATATLNGQGEVEFSIELELENISREMMGHLGLLPKHKEISASSNSIDPRPGAISLPQITVHSLFTALEHVSTLETGFQRLQSLESPLSSIIEVLHRKYPHIEFVQKLCPVALMPKSLTFTMPLETAATYRVFTAYLLFTSLTPHDILGILSDALLASEKSTYSMDSIKCSQEAALVEYFHFLLLFLAMYNFDYRIRHLETSPLQDKNISFHAQRILSWRLTTWVQGYFRPERPLHLHPLKIESDNIPQSELPIDLLPGREPMDITTSSASLEMGPVSNRASSWPALRSSQLYPAVIQQQQQNLTYLLTQEQRKVVDTDVSMGELMHVIAYDGTGKTVCLAEYAKIRPHKRFLYVTSSSIAALNAEKRFPRNITCKPMYSVAYHAIVASASKIEGSTPDSGKPLKERRQDYELEEVIRVLGLDEGKIGSALVNPQMHLQPGASRLREQTEMKRFPSVKEVALMVHRVLVKYWESKDVEIGSTSRFVEIDNMGLDRDIIVEWARQLWSAMLNTKHLLHDAYTKILQLRGALPDGSTIGQGDVDTLAFGEYDIIIWDRAQYLSGSVVDIFLRQRLRVGLIILGDPYQRIHGPERKKDEASDIEAYKPTYSYYLTHSFRFGDAIAGVANVLLGYLGENTAINGVRKHDSVGVSYSRISGKSLAQKSIILKPGPTENGGSGKYTIIFRRDADLIDYVIEYCMLHSHSGHRISLGTNCGFNGRNLIALLRDAYKLYTGKPNIHGVLAEYETWKALREAVNLPHSGPALVKEPKLRNRYRSLDFLYFLELYEKMVLDDSYKETEADVIFITVHKAKGLTWDRVFVPDSVLRYRFNLSAENLNKNWRHWFSRDKMSLLYVAVTRAKKELIIGKGIASWLVAKMGLYRFYLSPIQGKDACPSCLDTTEQHDNIHGEARPKREGVVIGWEYLLPQKSFGVIADSYGNFLPQSPKKDAVACDICAKSWNCMARAAHIELKKFANPITRAIDGPDSAMNQIMFPNMRWRPPRAPVERLNSRLFKTMYRMQIEMVQDCDETPYMYVMPTRMRRRL